MEFLEFIQHYKPLIELIVNIAVFIGGIIVTLILTFRRFKKILRAKDSEIEAMENKLIDKIIKVLIPQLNGLVFNQNITPIVKEEIHGSIKELTEILTTSDKNNADRFNKVLRLLSSIEEIYECSALPQDLVTKLKNDIADVRASSADTRIIETTVEYQEVKPEVKQETSAASKKIVAR